MTTVLQCPRCGSEPKERTLHGIDVIMCTGCGSVVSTHGGQTALAKWMARSDIGECPHCGGDHEDRYINLTGYENTGSHIKVCKGCGNSIGSATIEETIKKSTARF